jgi:mono/diheme cytochrome c family protein
MRSHFIAGHFTEGLGVAMALVALVVSVAANAADVAAGRAAAQAKCVACHEADDWNGESAASLQSIISDIVAGKVKHKQKIQLSPAEIDNIAAYWANGKK